MNKKMAALSLYGVGDLRLIETGVPVCGENEVLIKIKNCGICGSDIGRIFKTGTYHFPTIPGHEFAGEVVFDPDGGLNGKRMVVFPLLPCFVCEMCKKGRYAQCSSYDYYGSRCNGAFAEYIAVKTFNLLEIPDSVSFEEGAMCEPVSVALHAVKKAGIKKGDTVLVSGAGPIGLIAGQWAKILGAKRVRMFDIDSEKIEFCRKSGFSEYQKNDKFQIAIEGTGAGDALARIIKGISPGGTIVLMGNPANEVSLSAENYQLILRKELKLKGTWNSSYSDAENDWTESLAAMSERKLSLKPLITHRVSLSECPEMLEKMRDKKEFYCKVMIDNEK